jgi:excinuclease ABC subunit B
MNKLPKNYNGIVEQIIRPTGLLDPIIDIRPIDGSKTEQLKAQLVENEYTDMKFFHEKGHSKNQIDDLLEHIQSTIQKGQRVLVTTLTKRMAEELASFLENLHIKVQYLHSDIDTVERVKILRDLRLGLYDVLVGINLLREGLDLPEVSLVAILDADKEGFLRSHTSLIQTIGRAARHQDGQVILYAQHITRSMKLAIDETRRRRSIQELHNKKYNITPTTVQKEIRDLLVNDEIDNSSDNESADLVKKAEQVKAMSKVEKKEYLKELETQMNIYADMLEYEKAAEIRDLINEMKNNKT